MGRNYSMPTIKILFGQASSCAHPDCNAPLTFEERGHETVVAQIAHIRSESPGGPRHDPTFTGDLNGPENLLLLCGTHHPPVDRHESAYKVEELLEWKATQREHAGSGTSLSDSDARYFARLSQEERDAITAIARRAQRVTDACLRAQEAMDKVAVEAEAARQKAARSMFIYEVDDEGNRTRVSDQIELSLHERRQWAAKADEAWAAEQPQVVEALGALSEEIAVLRMFAGSLAAPAEEIGRSATAVSNAVGGDRAEVETRIATTVAQIAELWQIANGEAAPSSS